MLQETQKNKATVNIFPTWFSLHLNSTTNLQVFIGLGSRCKISVPRKSAEFVTEFVDIAGKMKSKQYTLFWVILKLPFSEEEPYESEVRSYSFL